MFWTTGACLFKYGQNKDKAAEYMKALTYNDGIWKDSISGSTNGSSGPAPAIPVRLCKLGRVQAGLDAGLGAPGARPAASG